MTAMNTVDINIKELDAAGDEEELDDNYKSSFRLSLANTIIILLYRNIFELKQFDVIRWDSDL